VPAQLTMTQHNDPVDQRLPRRIDAYRNREHILDAAAATLRINRGASLEEIIADTGLGRTTVYRHFPNRAALIDALVTRLLDAVRGLLDRARPAEPPFDAALARMTETAMTAGTQAWDLLSLATDDILASSPPVTNIVDAARALMQLGVDEGRLRSDVPLDWHVEAYFALTAAAVKFPNSRQAGAAWRTVQDVFLHGLEASPNAAELRG